MSNIKNACETLFRREEETSIQRTRGSSLKVESSKTHDRRTHDASPRGTKRDRELRRKPGRDSRKADYTKDHWGDAWTADHPTKSTSDSRSTHHGRADQDDLRGPGYSRENRNDSSSNHNGSDDRDNLKIFDYPRHSTRDSRGTEYRSNDDQDHEINYGATPSWVDIATICRQDGIHEVPVKSSCKNIKKTGPIKATSKEAVKAQSTRKKGMLKKDDDRVSEENAVKTGKSSSLATGTEGDLSVVIYHRVDQGARHWSLFYRSNCHRGTISEAAGPPGQFLYQEIPDYEVTVQGSSLFEQEIPVAYIPSYPRYLGSVSGTPMQNNRSDWNCQNWVLEALEGLYLESILDEDEYNDAADKLRPLMG